MDDNIKMVLLCGVCFIAGIVVTLVIIGNIIYAMGNSFQVESMNVTVSINQSMIIDAINAAVNNTNRIP